MKRQRWILQAVMYVHVFRYDRKRTDLIVAFKYAPAVT